MLKINDLPCPDFEETYFDKYFWPECVLPLLTSRGCYWGRCTFCDHSHIYQGYYQKRDKENVISDINYLIKRHGVKYFNFHDEAIKPSALTELVEIFDIYILAR